MLEKDGLNVCLGFYEPKGHLMKYKATSSNLTQELILGATCN